MPCVHDARQRCRAAYLGGAAEGKLRGDGAAARQRTPGRAVRGASAALQVGGARSVTRVAASPRIGCLARRRPLCRGLRGCRAGLPACIATPRPVNHAHGLLHEITAGTAGQHAPLPRDLLEPLGIHEAYDTPEHLPRDTSARLGECMCAEGAGVEMPNIHLSKKPVGVSARHACKLASHECMQTPPPMRYRAPQGSRVHSEAANQTTCQQPPLEHAAPASGTAREKTNAEVHHENTPPPASQGRPSTASERKRHCT